MTPRLPAPLIADLRTDHAGESGAVMIYRGILAITRDGAVRHFACEHLANEAGHLAAIEPLLCRQQRSRLLPLWRIAGLLTGARPALAGQPPALALRVWVWLVGTGSRVAVKICRVV